MTAIASAVGLIAAPASAAAPNRCTSPDNIVRCIYIDRNQDGSYYIEVSIEVPMSMQDAQAIIDQPGDPFTVKMVGSDPFADNNLFNLDTDSLIPSASGLGGQFSQKMVPGDWLDEDDSAFDQVDEVFARIVLTDLRTNTTRTFNTVIVSQRF